MAVISADYVEHFLLIILAVLAIVFVGICRYFMQFKIAGIPEAPNFKNEHFSKIQKYFASIETYNALHNVTLQRLYNVLTSKVTAGDACREVYTKMKSKGHKFAASFLPFPAFIPIDPELIKHIMQRDFDHFVNRGVYYNETSDPLTAHLFALENAKWRNLRSKLTPTFTSGQLKMMFDTVLKTNNDMKHILDNVPELEAFELKDIMVRLNMDIIGSCAFGLEMSSLRDPETPFRQQSKKLFHGNLLFNLKLLIANTFPNLCNRLGVVVINKEASAFYINLVKSIVSYREEENIYRKDFMHLLIQLKNKGHLTDDETLHSSEDGSNKSVMALTMNELAAQAFVFFAAGYETSSSVISYTMYELSRHPEIQERARREIDTVLARHGGEITYEAILEMIYVEMVINEAMRKYPTLPVLHRKTTFDYKIPETNIILKKGTKVLISTKGLSHDPEYYPDPEKFDPERFSDQNKNQRHPFTFLPFGEGPRACIGLRFGILQTKVAVTVLLKNYEFTLNKKTGVPLRSDPSFTSINVPLGGIWVNIKQIAKTSQIYKI